METHAGTARRAPSPWVPPSTRIRPRWRTGAGKQRAGATVVEGTGRAAAAVWATGIATATGATAGHTAGMAATTGMTIATTRGRTTGGMTDTMTDTGAAEATAIAVTARTGTTAAGQTPVAAMIAAADTAASASVTRGMAAAAAMGGKILRLAPRGVTRLRRGRRGDCNETHTLRSPLGPGAQAVARRRAR